jgi:hypothetical protein
MSNTPRRLAPDERVPSTLSLLPDTTHTKAHDITISTAPKLAHVNNDHKGHSPTYLASSQPVAQPSPDPIPKGLGFRVSGASFRLVVGSHEGEALARARVQCRRLRSVHWPRMRFRWVGERFPVFVSPKEKPIRISLTSWGGGVAGTIPIGGGQ